MLLCFPLSVLPQPLEPWDHFPLVTSKSTMSPSQRSLHPFINALALTHWCKRPLSCRPPQGAAWVKGRRGWSIQFKSRLQEERIAFICWVNPPFISSASTARPGPQLRLVKVGEVQQFPLYSREMSILLPWIWWKGNASYQNSQLRGDEVQRQWG